MTNSLMKMTAEQELLKSQCAEHSATAERYLATISVLEKALEQTADEARIEVQLLQDESNQKTAIATTMEANWKATESTDILREKKLGLQQQEIIRLTLNLAVRAAAAFARCFESSASSAATPSSLLPTHRCICASASASFSSCSSSCASNATTLLLAGPRSAGAELDRELTLS